MKLFKKVSAVVLALAMIVVLIPQLGSIAKGEEANFVTYKWDVDEDKAEFAEGAVIVGTSISISNSGYSSKQHTKAVKFGSSQRFTFTIPAGKFAKITVWSLTNGDTESKFTVGDQSIIEQKAAGSDVDELVHVIPGIFAGGESGTAYEMKRNSGGVLIYRVQVDVYDNETDVPQDKVETKVTVSGTITSDVSLEGGTINLLGDKTAKGDLKLKDGTTNQYEYSIDEVVGDGMEYYIDIEADAITIGKVLLRSDLLKQQKFTVETENITNNDFELKYEPIENSWDFTNANMSNFSKENISELFTYKGLQVDVTTGKFSKGSGNFQINTGTKITIPVSGWGTVVCEFTSKPTSATKLGEATGDGQSSTITYNYQNAKYIELSIGEGLYLTKIEVTPDTANPPVLALGASVRQETAEWGNGIRFGGLLNLNKVGENSTSGTLIGLKSVVNDATMTLEDVQKTCINVERTTYIEQDESSLEYAAALINIPDENLDTEIVARPYVTIGDNTYYGEQTLITYNTAQKIVNGQ